MSGKKALEEEGLVPKEKWRDKASAKVFQTGVKFLGYTGHGIDKGAGLFDKFFSRYKLLICLALIIVLLYCLFKGYYTEALIAYGILHLHLLFNQIWNIAK